MTDDEINKRLLLQNRKYKIQDFIKKEELVMVIRNMNVEPIVEVKVKCNSVEGGFPEHAEKLKLLEVDKEYTVIRCLITDAFTFLWFKELEGLSFNSIHFDVIGYKHLYDGVFEGQMHLVTGEGENPVN